MPGKEEESMARCPTCNLDPEVIALTIEALNTVLEGHNEESTDITVCLDCGNVALTAFANPPAEIIRHFSGPGTVHAVYDLLYDSDLKHIIVVQYENLFAITYTVWKDNTWNFTPEQLLEVYIVIDNKAQILWSASPPQPPT
jgi:hypothetical protein